MRMQKEAIVENMKDAGCPASFIADFLGKNSGPHGQKRLLHAHRKLLLEKIHENQKKLDCLDYLLFQLDKE